MGHEIFNELRKLRNEIAHRREPIDPEALSRRFAELGLSISGKDATDLSKAILSTFGPYGGFHYVPPFIIHIVAKILEGRSGNVICDPWAGIGELLSATSEFTKPRMALAFTQNESEFSLGRTLVSEAEWRLGDSLESLDALETDVDTFVSILPFGATSSRAINIRGLDGSPIELRDDLGNLILAASTARLSKDGLGLFVVPPSFFLSQRSVFRRFSELGFGVEAALALPSGFFAPYTNILTYLIVVQKRRVARMFVAQLSGDLTTNLQIFDNFKNGKEGGKLELGRLVEPVSFTGIDSIRVAERIKQASVQFDATAVQLGQLAKAVNLGRFGDKFNFSPQQNSIFVPLIGTSDVVDSIDELVLKHQNYAQIVIDPMQSDARFVARFLNSEFGKEIRELNKFGFIPKLNKQTLLNISVFVPDLATQQAMLETEGRIAAEQNTLLGIQNDLSALQRELWSNPRSVADVNRRLSAISSQLSGSLKKQAADGLDQWFEGLPFPLASISRAWLSAPSQDFKTKHEHLLHFFEATAEFLSVILLSAFSSNDALFAEHKQRIAEELRRQNLSFGKATFGTWKLVVEYLSKQTRRLLSADKDTKALCGQIFSDRTFELPNALSRKELVTILQATNKMRNDWTGHGGVVGQPEARFRNEQLIGELQKLREAFADTWVQSQLIQAGHCRPRRGVFETEISVLMGSNSEFLKETRAMGTFLDVERLYIGNVESGQALKLLPLIEVGPSPRSAKNACYFFNRVEKNGGARFISYHYLDKPELTGEFDQARDTIKLLSEV